MCLYAALDGSLESTSVCIIDREDAAVLKAVFGDDPDVVAKRQASHRLQLSAPGSSGTKVGSCATAPSGGVSTALTPAAGGGPAVADGQMSMWGSG